MLIVCDTCEHVQVLYFVLWLSFFFGTLNKVIPKSQAYTASRQFFNNLVHNEKVTLVRNVCRGVPRDQPEPGSFSSTTKEAEKIDPGNEVAPNVDGEPSRPAILLVNTVSQKNECSALLHRLKNLKHLWLPTFTKNEPLLWLCRFRNWLKARGPQPCSQSSSRESNVSSPVKFKMPADCDQLLH